MKAIDIIYHQDIGTRAAMALVIGLNGQNGNRYATSISSRRLENALGALSIWLVKEKAEDREWLPLQHPQYEHENNIVPQVAFEILSVIARIESSPDAALWENGCCS